MAQIWLGKGCLHDQSWQEMNNLLLRLWVPMVERFCCDFSKRRNENNCSDLFGVAIIVKLLPSFYGFYCMAEEMIACLNAVNENCDLVLAHYRSSTQSVQRFQSSKRVKESGSTFVSHLVQGAVSGANSHIARFKAA